MKLLIIVFVSFTALAQVKVEKDFSGRFFLKSSNCEKVSSNYKAIVEWSKYRKTPISNEILSRSAACTCAKQICRADITSILPKEVSKLTGVCTIHSGPNCFNTALNDQKVLTKRRVVTGQELKFLVTSDLCKEVPSNEKPKAGSMIVISENEELPLHGFTYISDDLVFSKASPNKKHEYKLTGYKSMLKAYGLPENCWHVSGNPDDSTCPKYANVYNCQSFEEYRASKPIKNKELAELFKTFDSFECTAEKSLFNDLLGMNASLELMKSSLQAFRMKIIDNRDDPKLSAQESFYWNMAWHKFIGIEKQLRLIK